MKTLSRKIIKLVIQLNIAYVVVSIISNWFNHPLPSELTIAWFTFTGTELLGLVWLKTKKMNSPSVEETEVNNGNQ